MAKAKEKEVAVEEKKEVAVMDMEADAGRGYENLGQEDSVIPFLRVVQKTSPIELE